YLGFLLKPRTGKDSPVILFGTRRDRGLATALAKLAPVAPRPKTPPEIAACLKDVSFLFDRGLVCAIQCKARGWDELARALFDAFLKRNKAGLFPRTILAEEAWLYWERELSEPDSDWKKAARGMKQALAAEPSLDTEENQKLLKS